MFHKLEIFDDFNINHACCNSSSEAKKYADSNASLGCEQLIIWPTKIASTRQSIIDHVYVDSCIIINDVATVAVIEHDIVTNDKVFLTRSWDMCQLDKPFLVKS